jgi:hypothetical protein
MQLRGIVYTNSQDMLVLSSAVALRYYNCCTDGRDDNHVSVKNSLVKKEV